MQLNSQDDVCKVGSWDAILPFLSRENPKGKGKFVASKQGVFVATPLNQF